jgi:hypothetical protein
MEHMAAPIAKLSHTSATMSIVCLAVSSLIRSARRRASSARWCQNSGSLTSGAMGMERALSRTTHLNSGNAMWWLFQVLIMTLIIGSNGAYHWAPKGGGFAVALLAAFAAMLNDLLLWRAPIGRQRESKKEAAKEPSGGLKVSNERCLIPDRGIAGTRSAPRKPNC